MRKYIVELRRGEWVPSRFRWVLKGGNGEIMASSQTYSRKDSCRRTARKVAAALGLEVTEVE